MTREEIGSVLKQLRISSGKTQKEIAKILGRTQQIIGHWETGYSQPDANTLFILCDIYGTTVDSAFGFKKTNISQDDLMLLKKYHDIDPVGQKHVNMVLDWETARVQQLTKLCPCPPAIAESSEDPAPDSKTALKHSQLIAERKTKCLN